VKVQTVNNVPEQIKPIVAPPVSLCDLADSYNWNAQIARAVCMAESHGRANAYRVNTNGTNDAGIMQINSIHADLISSEDRFDPIKNMRAAYQIYQGSGWKAWSSYNSDKYKEFL
jgi:hypothetical protein